MFTSCVTFVSLHFFNIQSPAEAVRVWRTKWALGWLVWSATAWTNVATKKYKAAKRSTYRHHQCFQRRLGSVWRDRLRRSSEQDLPFHGSGCCCQRRRFLNGWVVSLFTCLLTFYKIDGIVLSEELGSIHSSDHLVIFDHLMELAWREVLFIVSISLDRRTTLTETILYGWLAGAGKKSFKSFLSVNSYE